MVLTLSEDCAVKRTGAGHNWTGGPDKADKKWEAALDCGPEAKKERISVMQMPFRELITALHGMGFGAFFLLTFSGALIELNRIRTSTGPSAFSSRELRLLRAYLIAMCVLGWGAVFSGAYIVYPWYRAHPPAETTDYREYPQMKLLSSPTTAGWHNFGMEWKEHVAWFAPIAMTMVAYVIIKYGSGLSRHRQVRNAVFAFAAAAFIAAGIAGIFGALINKNAPVQDGATMSPIGKTK
jgi:hypothetical protein